MRRFLIISILLVFCCNIKAFAGVKIELKDPKGDDKGPGNYEYPTDPVYVPGSFDLLACEIKDKGDKIEFAVKFNAEVSFSWGDYWDVQMIQIYLDFDGVKGSGHTETLPGAQVVVDSACAWEKLVFIDPHTVAKINGEIGLKAKDLAPDIVLPSKIKPIGKKIKATVKKEDLGVAEDVDITQWGYGILMLSATGFPASWSVLARRANEYNGQHRYGGGWDGTCDPNVIDMFVDDADGSEDEAQIQYDMLGTWGTWDEDGNCTCNMEDELSVEEVKALNNKYAVIKFVYPGKK